MKRQMVNFIAAIGILLLAVSLLATLVVVTLFSFPKLNIMGATAVNISERDTQITYDDPLFADMFSNGKFIIQSKSTNIQIKMANRGINKTGTISIHEQATGIAFNSLQRTLVEWTQTLVNGEKYYRIQVLEPEGVVFNGTPTIVTLNMPYVEDPTFKYDFILDNTYGAVDFSYADPNNVKEDQFLIGDLTVKSATAVNLPNFATIKIDQINLQSKNTAFTCGGIVNGDVTVNGTDGTQVFNDRIYGNLYLKGNNNTCRGTSATNVVYEQNLGSLSMNEVDNLNVSGTTATVHVDTVSNGVTMQARNGELKINKILSGGLDFTSNETAKVIVTKCLYGSTDIKQYGTGTTELHGVFGKTTVNNQGVGNVALLDVDGDVEVNSETINGGTVTVEFNAANKMPHSAKVYGRDGNIAVRNIYGQLIIEIKHYDLTTGGGAGKAKIQTTFRRVIGNDNHIYAGGYRTDTPYTGEMAYVNVGVMPGCNNFNLQIDWARTAIANKSFGYDYNVNGLNVGAINPIILDNEMPTSGTLCVQTPTQVSLSN